MDNINTLIELKASAYDAAVQVRAWQDKLNKLTEQINNYVEPVKQEEKQQAKENGTVKDKNKSKNVNK